MEDGAAGRGSGWWGVLLLLLVPFFVGAWYNVTHRIGQKQQSRRGHHLSTARQRRAQPVVYQ